MTQPSPVDDPVARAVRARVTELLALARSWPQRRPVELPEPEVRFDLRGMAAGQYRWRAGERPVLRFNLALARTNRVDFLARTVPHEVAHLITFAWHGRTAPHGAAWRAVMRGFGIDRAERCHDYRVDEDAIRRQRRWRYHCGCRDHALSSTRHNRVVRGSATYVCRRCGAALHCIEPPVR